jgi:hypothetical protein
VEGAHPYILKKIYKRRKGKNFGKKWDVLKSGNINPNYYTNE